MPGPKCDRNGCRCDVATYGACFENGPFNTPYYNPFISVEPLSVNPKREAELRSIEAEQFRRGYQLCCRMRDPSRPQWGRFRVLLPSPPAQNAPTPLPPRPAALPPTIPAPMPSASTTALPGPQPRHAPRDDRLLDGALVLAAAALLGVGGAYLIQRRRNFMPPRIATYPPPPAAWDREPLRAQLRLWANDFEASTSIERARKVQEWNHEELRNQEALVQDDYLPGKGFELGNVSTYDDREMLRSNFRANSEMRPLLDRIAAGVAQHRKAGTPEQQIVELIATFADTNYSRNHEHDVVVNGADQTGGVFVVGGGCCRHRSQFLQMALQEAGIPSRYVRGRLIGGSHAWVEVDVKGDVSYDYAVDLMRRKWGPKETAVPVPDTDELMFAIRGDGETFFVDKGTFNVIWRRRTPEQMEELLRPAFEHLCEQLARVDLDNARTETGHAEIERVAGNLVVQWASKGREGRAAIVKALPAPDQAQYQWEQKISREAAERGEEVPAKDFLIPLPWAREQFLAMPPAFPSTQISEPEATSQPTTGVGEVPDTLRPPAPVEELESIDDLVESLPPSIPPPAPIDAERAVEVLDVVSQLKTMTAVTRHASIDEQIVMAEEILIASDQYGLTDDGAARPDVVRWVFAQHGIPFEQDLGKVDDAIARMIDQLPAGPPDPAEMPALFDEARIRQENGLATPDDVALLETLEKGMGELPASVVAADRRMLDRVILDADTTVSNGKATPAQQELLDLLGVRACVIRGSSVVFNPGELPVFVGKTLDRINDGTATLEQQQLWEALHEKLSATPLAAVAAPAQMPRFFAQVQRNIGEGKATPEEVALQDALTGRVLETRQQALADAKELHLRYRGLMDSSNDQNIEPLTRVLHERLRDAVANRTPVIRIGATAPDELDALFDRRVQGVRRQIWTEEAWFRKFDYRPQEMIPKYLVMDSVLPQYAEGVKFGRMEAATATQILRQRGFTSVVISHDLQVSPFDLPEDLPQYAWEEKVKVMGKDGKEVEKKVEHNNALYFNETRLLVLQRAVFLMEQLERIPELAARSKDAIPHKIAEDIAWGSLMVPSQDGIVPAGVVERAAKKYGVELQNAGPVRLFPDRATRQQELAQHHAALFRQLAEMPEYAGRQPSEIAAEALRLTLVWRAQSESERSAAKTDNANPAMANGEALPARWIRERSAGDLAVSTRTDVVARALADRLHISINEARRRMAADASFVNQELPRRWAGMMPQQRAAWHAAGMAAQDPGNRRGGFVEFQVHAVLERMHGGIPTPAAAVGGGRQEADRASRKSRVEVVKARP